MPKQLRQSGEKSPWKAMTEDRMFLLDPDGTTEYDWKRVEDQ